MALLGRKKSAPSQAAGTGTQKPVVGVALVPLVSEKSSRLVPLGQYTFAAHPDTTKIMVKKMVERTYNVHVVGVNSVRLPRKFVRRGRSQGFTRVRKHFVVRLRAGETIAPKA
jgi:large subunit ribosomal protein L23